MKSRKDVINEIIEHFKNDEDAFIECIEELDNWCGFLDGKRWYEMDMLDYFLQCKTPSSIINMTFFGYDLDNWTEDSHGERVYGKFNPNSRYFKYNGYGNLVSSYYKDYKDYLDSDFVEKLKDERPHLSSISNDIDLDILFDDLEEAEA